MATHRNRAYHAVYFDRRSDPDLFGVACGLRRKIFVDQRGWQLDVTDGREEDRFDSADATYCILSRNGRSIGTFRATGTHHPYLASAVFGRLASVCALPADDRSIEISRFGIDADLGDREDAGTLYSLMFVLGRSRFARSFVAVADLAHERLLRSLGVLTIRFGPPGFVGIDRHGRPIEAVVGEIPIAMQGGPRFQQLVDLTRNVEIIDAAHVLGPQRLSA